MRRESDINKRYAKISISWKEFSWKNNSQTNQKIMPGSMTWMVILNTISSCCQKRVSQEIIVHKNSSNDHVATVQNTYHLVASIRRSQEIAIISFQILAQKGPIGIQKVIRPLQEPPKRTNRQDDRPDKILNPVTNTTVAGSEKNHWLGGQDDCRRLEQSEISSISIKQETEHVH